MAVDSDAMKYIAAPLLAIALVACGGGSSSEVWHLREMDIEPGQYRAYLRAQLSGNLLAAGLVCDALGGLSNDETVTYLRTLGARSTSTPTLPPGATPRPGQEPDPGDIKEAAALYQAECQRMFPG